MRRTVFCVALIGLLVGACSDGESAQTPTPTEATTTQPTTTAEATTVAPESPSTLPSSTQEPDVSEPPANAPEPTFAVDDMVFDAEGVLWVTTGDNRRLKSGVSTETPRHIYRLVGDTWQIVDQPTVVFNEPHNWEIRAASDGGVYLGSGFNGPPSPTSGVFRTDGVTWELFEQDFTCGSLAVDSKGTLWATCPDFLTRLVDGRWVAVAEGSAARSVATGPDGSVWFTTFGAPPHEVWRFDGARWSSIALCENCYGPRSIVGIDSDGGAWVARGECGLQGTTRFDPSGESEDIELKGVRDIVFAADGAVWAAVACPAAHLSGVVRYFDGDVQRYTTDDGLPSNRVQAVELSPDGSIYAGTEFGVFRYVVGIDSWEPVGTL